MGRVTRSYGKGETLLIIEDVPVVSCPHCGTKATILLHKPSTKLTASSGIVTSWQASALWRSWPLHSQLHQSSGLLSPAPAARTTTASPGCFLRHRRPGRRPLTLPSEDNPCGPPTWRATFKAIPEGDATGPLPCEEKGHGHAHTIRGTSVA